MSWSTVERTRLQKAFDDRTIKSGDDDCWEWVGARRSGNGIGYFQESRGNGGKHYPARRLAFMLATSDDIPPAAGMIQTCGNIQCVNPRHIKLANPTLLMGWGDDEPMIFASRRDGCVIPDCAAAHYGRGLCRRHYKQAHAAGNLPPLRRETSEERFNRSFTEGEPDECWHWTSKLDPNGYGVMSIHGMNVAAHRYSWERVNGPIPDGLVIDHLCHNADRACVAVAACMHRRCVNPTHLEPTTRGDNIKRSHLVHARKDECVHGHDLTDDAVVGWDVDGKRFCRPCARANAAAFRQRKRDAQKNTPLPVCECGRTCKAFYSTACHRCLMRRSMGLDVTDD